MVVTFRLWNRQEKGEKKEKRQDEKVCLLRMNLIAREHGEKNVFGRWFLGTPVNSGFAGLRFWEKSPKTRK